MKTKTCFAFVTMVFSFIFFMGCTEFPNSISIAPPPSTDGPPVSTSDKAVSQVAQSACSDSGSSFSQSTSGTQTFSAEDLAFAKTQANYFTEHLVERAFDSSVLNGISSAAFSSPSFDQIIYHFIIGAYHYKDTDEYLYTRYFDDGWSTSNQYAYFPLAQVQTVVYEVFGLNDWFFNSDSFNSDIETYEVPLETGSYSLYSINNLSVSVNDSGLITASFNLTGSILFPDPIDYGPYVLTLQTVKENDHLFLRFVSFYPTNK